MHGVHEEEGPPPFMLGTSKFFIVPFGLGGLWVSWDDLFFGSPLVLLVLHGSQIGYRRSVYPLSCFD